MEEVLHILVEGQVQGVGFRYFTERIALRLQVAGWVRNLPDGRVEVLARVTPSAKGPFLAALQEGPSMGHVSRLDVQKEPAGVTCPRIGFQIRHVSS